MLFKEKNPLEEIPIMMLYVCVKNRISGLHGAHPFLCKMKIFLKMLKLNFGFKLVFLFFRNQSNETIFVFK